MAPLPKNCLPNTIGPALLPAIFSGPLSRFLCGRCGRFVATDRVEHFAAVDRHLFGGLNPQADLVPPDLDHDNGNVIIDDNTLILLPRQYEHGDTPFRMNVGLLTSIKPSWPDSRDLLNYSTYNAIVNTLNYLKNVLN